MASGLKKILWTGAAGFIGTNFWKYVIPKYQDRFEFVSIDRIDDFYGLNFIPDNHKFYLADITDQHIIDRIFDIERPDYVIAAASKSFVDSSIEDPSKFSHSNVYGNQVLVEASVKYQVNRFLYVGTDESKGSLKKDEPSWNELSPNNPKNNYSASKAGAEFIVKAAHNVHGLPYSITNCCNNYGPFQPFRNLFPKIAVSILLGKPIPIHGDGSPIREWIYAQDHAEAWMHTLINCPANESYVVGGNFSCSNLELVQIIARELKTDPVIEFVAERKGQDYRYSVDDSKLKKTGWNHSVTWEEGLKLSCQWYKDNLHLFKDV